MAYKSKRTRDLQGEVQAGTNVSVVETTKPDGTKVYTLSAEGGSNEFDEVKIIDSDNNVKMLLDTDGVRIYNDDGNEVAVLTYQEFILRDDNSNDRVYINRDGTIYCNNSNGNETLSIDYDSGNIYIKNDLGSDKCVIDANGNLADLRLFDEYGNEVLSGVSLIDMQNSLWSFAPGIEYLDVDNNTSFGLDTSENILEEFCIPNNVRGDDYYEIEDTEYTNILGYSANGILCRYAGTYEITINASVSSDASNGGIKQRIDVIKNHNLIESRLYHLDLGKISLSESYGGLKSTKFIITTNEDNTYIAPYWYYNYFVGYKENIATGEYTTITIQKIR